MVRPVFANHSARQESFMNLEKRRAAPIPSILATPRSFLAAVLSVACVFSLGIDMPSLSAAPSLEKDKKAKQDPALKNLPITDLSGDEAILHALNRLSYG